MVMGRPPKFNEIYAEIKETYVQERAKGVSIWRWCGERAISLSTIEKYKQGQVNDEIKNSDQYKDFLRILEHGDNLYRAHVHDIVSHNADGTTKGNGACANFIASNVLGWSSRQDQRLSPGEDVKEFKLSYSVKSEED